MREKQKAKELVDRMHLFSSGDSGKDDLTKANAKQCALICVEEKIKQIRFIHDGVLIKKIPSGEAIGIVFRMYEHLKRVRAEIEKL